MSSIHPSTRSCPTPPPSSILLGPSSPRTPSSRQRKNSPKPRDPHHDDNHARGLRAEPQRRRPRCPQRLAAAHPPGTQPPLAGGGSRRAAEVGVSKDESWSGMSHCFIPTLSSFVRLVELQLGALICCIPHRDKSRPEDERPLSPYLGSIRWNTANLAESRTSNMPAQTSTPSNAAFPPRNPSTADIPSRPKSSDTGRR